jgi:pyrrolysyl-tRNA synthetase-like protein
LISRVFRLKKWPAMKDYPRKQATICDRLEFFILSDEKTNKQPARRYYRKRVEIFRLIEKIKLWPSRRGLLHGIRTIDVIGDQARITTHCNKTFLITNSRNSRAARWLRNKWFRGVCGVCRVPDWKLAKYSSTHFKRHYGSALSQGSKESNKERTTNIES